jgi:hypothetical protein
MGNPALDETRRVEIVDGEGDFDGGKEEKDTGPYARVRLLVVVLVDGRMQPAGGYQIGEKSREQVEPGQRDDRSHGPDQRDTRPPGQLEARNGHVFTRQSFCLTKRTLSGHWKLWDVKCVKKERSTEEPMTHASPTRAEGRLFYTATMSG